MQSFVQYRRIGQAIRRQVARDSEKGGSRGARTPHEPVGQSPSRENEDTLKKAAENGDPRPTEPVQDASTSSLSTTQTHKSRNLDIGPALDGVHVRDRTTHEGKGQQVLVVGWAGDDDPNNPRNFSTTKRALTTLLVAAVAFVVTAASSIDSAILPQAAAEFGVSEVVESLATGRSRVCRH